MTNSDSHEGSDTKVDGPEIYADWEINLSFLETSHFRLSALEARGGADCREEGEEEERGGGKEVHADKDSTWIEVSLRKLVCWNEL